MTDEPLDLTDVEAHPRVPRVVVGQLVAATAPAINRALDERDALLAEVKRLRAQVADAWDEGYRAGRGYEREFVDWQAVNWHTLDESEPYLPGNPYRLITNPSSEDTP